MVLKTVDWAAHPDAYVYGSQKNRESARLFGLLPNRTEDELPYENKTRKHFISRRLYNDSVPKVIVNWMVGNWRELAGENGQELQQAQLDRNGQHHGGVLGHPFPQLLICKCQRHFTKFIAFQNGGNIFPCRSEWVELEKFQMEVRVNPISDQQTFSA